uniref:Uncharacterized protein n=1 Tax=Ciona savignyi TaxID=51511 RepID=H2YMS3_CIOSA
MIKQSFEDEKMWLRFRELLLHSICSVLRKTSEDHRSNVHNGCSCHGPPDQLAPLVSEFEVFCSSLKQPKEDANPIHGPCGTRMKLALEAQYPTIMILLFKFSGDFLSLKSNPESENSSSILGTLTTTVK